MATVSPSRLDITREDHCTTENLALYIEDFMELVEEQGYTDEELWDIFQPEFDKWNASLFKMAGEGIVRQLRDFLRTRGVFVLCGRGISKASGLARILLEEHQHVWTPEEINEQVAKYGGFLVGSLNSETTKSLPFHDRYSTTHPPYTISKLPTLAISDRIFRQNRIAGKIFMVKSSSGKRGNFKT